MPDIEVAAAIGGFISTIVAQPGGLIAEQEPTIRIESMKMEVPVSAACSGRVREILAATSEIARERQILAIIGTE
jgi:biotin carboxyl carrier protein